MSSDLQRVAQGLIDALDQNPRAAADLRNAAAQCMQLAGQVAELAVLLPEAAAAAEYLAEAARACDEAGNLVSGATTAGRAWAVSAVGTAGQTAGDLPNARDTAAGNKPEPSTRPAQRDEAGSDSPSQPGQIQLDFSDLVPPAGAAVADTAKPVVLELSTTDPAHRPVLSAPPANATVVVDGRFTYKTDDRGRVVSATATLDSVDLEHPRDSTAQRRLPGKLPGDHAGHIFARIFQGPMGTVNRDDG